jgi:hypothetical protein
MLKMDQVHVTWRVGRRCGVVATRSRCGPIPNAKRPWFARAASSASFNPVELLLHRPTATCLRPGRDPGIASRVRARGLARHVASGQSEPQRDVSLAGAAVADRDNVLAAGYVLRAGQAIR